MNKYKAVKAEADGIKFDSKKEMNRYLELKEKLNNGEISELKLQVTFTLIPKQEIDGKCVERAVKYIADFVYLDENGELVVEDVKGCKKGAAYTVFSMKRKLMLAKFGVRIREI